MACEAICLTDYVITAQVLFFDIMTCHSGSGTYDFSLAVLLLFCDQLLLIFARALAKANIDTEPRLALNHKYGVTKALNIT